MSAMPGTRTREMYLTMSEIESLDVQTMKDVSEAETMQWFAQNPTLDHWLPAWLQAWQRAYVISLMHWAEVMWANDESGFMCTPLKGTQAGPCMKWIWMNSESMTRDEFSHILCHAAQEFYNDVGWCCVYSPMLYETAARQTTTSVDNIVQQSDTRTGMMDFMEHVQQSEVMVQRSEDRVFMNWSVFSCCTRRWK
jgi:hypothetical protein